MLRISFIAIALCLSGLNVQAAVTLSDVRAALSASDCWHAEVDYSVSMPQMPDDIIYRLDMESMAAPSDTLAPRSYLIQWQLGDGTDESASPAGRQQSWGFSAYDNGHHYRFTSGRPLQEYHIDWDSIPFIPRLAGSSKAVAVQKSARFCELLPQMVAASFAQMEADPAFSFVVHPDTTVSGRQGCVVIDMQRVVDGYDELAQEGEYVFDGATLMPLRITMENNPGTSGEQTVIATYTPMQPVCQAPTEQFLAEKYPATFEQWRESNYRIETLPGHRLPEFSLPTVEGSRFTHGATEPMNAPTVIVVYDPGDSFTGPTIAAVREAMAQLPVASEALFAALSSNHDEVESHLPDTQPGEYRLMSAKGLARDCGVAATPSVIIVARDGTVADAIVGYSDDLATTLAQKMSLLR